jgi:PAS domain S-box-containing protein
MKNRHNPSATPIDPQSPVQLAVAICSVAALSYLAGRLGEALVLRPEMIWALWPGCALLVAVLLLSPRKIWPILLIAGLSGFALYDVQEHLPIRAIALLLASDAIEILVAAVGVSYVFRGVPCLNSVRSLAKYSFFAVIVAPIVASSIAASAFERNSWQISVLAEALALLTLTPAILGWLRIVASREKSKAYYLEAAAMCVGLATVAGFAFVASGSENQPVLLYSLVPFLLWASLRFGIAGASTSLVLVAFVAIWGTVHERGPFTGGTPVGNVMSLQVFLLVTGASFVVLSAVVEQQKKAERELAQASERLHLAIESGSAGGWEFTLKTGVNTWFGKAHSLLGMKPDETSGSRQAFWDRVHQDDCEDLREAVRLARERHEAFSEDFRVVWRDGTTHWLHAQGRYQYAANGEPQRMLGIAVDITQSKQAEQALRESEEATAGHGDRTDVCV